MTETYGRYLNALDMENTEKTAQTVGNTLPVLGTLSTYPAKLLGDISGDITALGSTMASDLGISHYNSIDVNHPGYGLSVYTDSLRGTVSDNLGGFGDLYDGVNGAVDELVQYAAAGATGIPAFNYVGNLGNTVRDTTMNGATRDQAMNLGIGKLGQDFIRDIAFGGTNPVDSWMTPENLQEQIKEELADEAFAYIKATGLKSLLNRHKEFTQRSQKLIEAGASQEEAFETIFHHMIFENLS